ncbi:hypothetical protein GCM10010321_05180 [Streptomyces chartreusis]|nr:hypothetical protein GCM10010321_05180 [Streptomyces chartreusis]
MAFAGTERVGVCVEKMGVARGERTDDQIGHGFLRDTGCLERSRSDREVHAGATEKGARGIGELHGTRLLPSDSGRGATQYVIFAGSVQRFPHCSRAAVPPMRERSRIAYQP